MKELTNCPICGDANAVSLHTLRIHDHFQSAETKLHKSNSYHRNYILFQHILRRRVDFLDVQFVMCNACGFIYFSPRPDASDLAIKYTLVSQQGDTVARERLRRLLDLRRVRAVAIVRRVRPYLSRHSGRAVDIGGADGHCLAGFTEELECGVVDYETRELWPGVRKLGNTLAELGSQDRFDLVLCCHTLEHVPDPLAFVREIVSHMSEQGTLYIEVPQGCAGEVYETDNILTHVNFFSPGSLGYLLERCGLHVQLSVAQATLSMNRYLPVVVAIATKDGLRQPDRHYTTAAAAITRREMRNSLDRQVLLSNARLVLSHPIAYGLAFVRRTRRLLSRART